MNLKDRVIISANTQGVVFICEGIFARVYNESAYILTSILREKLKLSYRRVQSAEDQFIIYCGFPKAKLLEKFPLARISEFGYILYGEFDLTGYSKWYQQQYAKWQKSFATKRLSRALADRSADAGDSKFHLELNMKQYNFLQNWQRGRYSLEVYEAFIISLKARLG